MSTSFELGFGTRGELRLPASLPAASTRLMSPGCLALWQARRVVVHIDTNLGDRLDRATLANVANLSPSHFCRAFKRTFGVSVHRYVMHRRIERAQHLMLATSEALSSIAISCGMTDQSHLTRWFQRVVGVPPAAWRRARFEPPVATDAR